MISIGRAQAPTPVGPLTVHSWGATHIGQERRTNEDQFVVAALMRALWIERSSVPQSNVSYGDERGHVFIVADGMGGANGGERASALAIGAVEGFLLNTLSWLLAMDGTAEDTALRAFQDTIRNADAYVSRAAEDDPGLQGMGTTLTLAYSLGSVLFVAHVGDSRCYLSHAGALQRLTRDDTLVQDMVESGLLAPSDAARHSLRHVITNVVGGGKPEAHVARYA
jgi:protein phosphatase